MRQQMLQGPTWPFLVWSYVKVSSLSKEYSIFCIKIQTFYFAIVNGDP